MKKYFKTITTCSVILVLVLSVTSFRTINSQTIQNSPATVVVVDSIAPIPDSINILLTRSCTPCHAGGNEKASLELDLSKWTEYTLQQSLRKGAEICETMTTGDMPPKKAIESNPELIVTAEQIAVVCKWVSSLTPKE